MELLMTKKINNTTYMKIINMIIPYIVIFCFCLVACSLNFKSGYPKGDDVGFQTAHIYDWYLELKGDGTQLISSNLAGGLGIGKKLFYSPLAHFVPAFIMYVFKVSLIRSMKITLFLSVYISGVFMYRFSLKITKGKNLLSILVAGLFIIWPYRLFDAYCRLAYAEAISFLFLPLFFMGIYDLCHKEQLDTITFLEIIFGGALVFLTHNLTGFYTYFFGIIYILINIKSIILKIIKNKMFIIYSLISVFIMVGMVSVQVFSSLSLLHKDFYNISNDIYMWVNESKVISEATRSADFSGFLNIVWLKNLNLDETKPTELVSSFLLFFVSILLFVGLNELFKYITKKYDKFTILRIINKFSIQLIPAFIIFIIFVQNCIERIEVTYASYLAGFLYVIVDLFEDNKNPNKETKLSTSFYSYVILLIITLLMIFTPFFWEHAPSIFLNIQFPWRLWAFVSVFVPIVVAYIFSKYNNKKGYVIILISIGFIISTTQATIEKRIKKATDKNTWIYTVDDSVFKSRSSTGWNDEYYPYMYYNSDDTYESLYSNSLYQQVKAVVANYNKKATDITPALLEGEGTVLITEGTVVPNYKLECNILSDEALVQLPIIYYPGYEIIGTIDGKKYNFKVVEVDGLVSFYAKKGEYVAKTEYVGTTLRHVTEVYQVLSVIALFGLEYLDFIVVYKKNQKKNLLLK
ncbi:MAG: hypothetical protein K6E20_01145 [Acholeplasmatales bacterium]|nr:hypothetical protein [Acholeplasmatales bacterium]